MAKPEKSLQNVARAVIRAMPAPEVAFSRGYSTKRTLITEVAADRKTLIAMLT